MEESGAEFTPAGVPDVYIAGLGEQACLFALELAQDLRNRQRQCLCDIVGRSVKAQMRYADKIGAKFSMVIGETELNEKKAVLKNMESKETFEVDITDINEIVKIIDGCNN